MAGEGLFLVLVSDSSSVYSAVKKLLESAVSPEEKVLLIDFECEFCLNSLEREIAVEYTVEIEEDYEEDVIIVNRVTSLISSTAEFQRRLNLLYSLVYKKKKVYITSEYRYYNGAKVIPYIEYIERMTEIENPVKV